MFTNSSVICSLAACATLMLSACGGGGTPDPANASQATGPALDIPLPAGWVASQPGIHTYAARYEWEQEDTIRIAWLSVDLEGNDLGQTPFQVATDRRAQALRNSVSLPEFGDVRLMYNDSLAQYDWYVTLESGADLLVIEAVRRPVIDPDLLIVMHAAWLHLGSPLQPESVEELFRHIDLK